MAVLYHKPETALKRADELVAVSQHGSALTLLHEILVNKRTRQTALPVLEPIVLKFLELSVLLGKGKLAREGLFQYKNIAQNTNMVITKFLQLAKDRLLDAQQEANQINLALIDDLEAAETPESIMMNTVSNEDSKERTDRQVVTPWFRFQWEAYRTALDTLRNNSKLESAYQDVANQAFGFCLKFERKIEFRRLCETLRQHLASASKHTHQLFALDLNSPETLRKHLDTRFSQLKTALDLKLYQEGFRSIEDIHSLIAPNPTIPKLKMMAAYYEKMATIMLVGENYLFHSAALYLNLGLEKRNPNLNMEWYKTLVTNFMLSVLAIPIVKNQAEQDDQVKNVRLHQLLISEEEMPSRDKLLRCALSEPIYSLVNPSVIELFKLLEVQFHPLSICQKVAPIIESFVEKGSKYVKPLHQTILTRLLQQLSQVYSSIKIEGVLKLAAFPAPYNYNAHSIENFVVIGCKKGEFSIRVSHQTQSLVFESNSFGPAEHTSLPADSMRSQLAQLTKRLTAAVELIDPSVKKAKDEGRVTALRMVVQNIEKDRATIFYRRSLIAKKAERRQEEIEKEEVLRQQRAVEFQITEKLRLAEEEKRMAADRLIQQRKEIERQEAQKLAEKIAAELREKNVKIKDDEILDTEKLIELQVQQLEKERRELARKSKSLTKRFDHTERAHRKEEIPFMKMDYINQEKEERELYETKTAATLEAAKIKHQQNLVVKQNISRIIGDYNEYRAKLVQEREEYCETLRAEAKLKIEAAKKERIKEHELQLVENERKAKEAVIAAANAEAEKKIKEEAARIRALAQAENEKKLNEQARKQRQKELEIEERLSAPPVAAAGPSVYRAGVSKIGATGGWRDREGSNPTSTGAPSIARTVSGAPSAARTASVESSSSAVPAWKANRTGTASAIAAFSSNKPKEQLKESTKEPLKEAESATSAGPPKVAKWVSSRNK